MAYKNKVPLRESDQIRSFFWSVFSHSVLVPDKFYFFLFWDTETISVSIFIHLFMIKFMVWSIIYKYQNVFYSFHFGREVCLIWGGNIWRTGVREDSDKREGGSKNAFLKCKFCVSSVLLTFSCSLRAFWKCLIVRKTLVRAKLKFHPFWGNWSLISIFGPVGSKLERSV